MTAGTASTRNKNNSLEATDLIGLSTAMLATKLLLDRVARRDASVLIEGETGTGKEVAARAIHYNGARKSNPFVPLNCGAIPDSLLESELFGHRQGAFTDAKRNTPGVFGLAHTGTLFLDEVDSLSPKAQVSILRFLQERTIKPLGEGREIKVDVRIIAACNCRLSELVAQHRFRQDLFYRLNVMHVELPPLREREGDIELLANHFLTQLAERYHESAPRLDDDSIAWLQAQPWPGNIRELENLLEREFLLHDGQPVLRFAELGGSASDLTSCASTCDRWNYRLAKERVLKDFNRRFLRELMRETRGNVTLAATAAGKERRDLGRMLRKHEISPESFRSATRN
jgi:transcriptional regulator with PAS, ATPase and Fis domain